MKRLRVILLFLLLGVVVNVGVAWGCVIFVNIESFIQRGLGTGFGPGVTSESGACWLLSRDDVFGSTLLIGSAFLEADRSDAHVMEYLSTHEQVPPVPVWSHFAIPPTIPTPSYIRLTIIEEARGWPFRTLYWFQSYPNQAIEGTSYNVRKHVWIVGESTNWIYLPLAPIWRGMLFNTFFYAFLLWLFIPGPFVLRRFIRRRRGLCVKCAYDLRGAEHEACPECGHNC